MAGSSTTQVSLATLVRGFDEAHARLAVAISKVETPPEQAFLPVFEALNWTVALSDLAEKSRVSIPVPRDDRRALQFVRNRVHHQWAQALELVEVLVPPSPIRAQGGDQRGGRVIIIRPAVQGE